MNREDQRISMSKEECKISMSGQERREKMVSMLQNTNEPVSGTTLAKLLDVSRQVVVQDIALLRAQKQDIISTCRGYIMQKQDFCQRIFKVKHTDQQMEEELNLFVDFGGIVEDEFVYHKVYNVLRAEISLKSRRDVSEYLEKLNSGTSKPLKDVTSGYHYHTITAENEQVLDQIQEELSKRGFLAQLRDYEPIEFWKKE